MRRGLTTSREEAQEAIAAGHVVVGGAPATKPSRLVDPAEAIALLAPPRPYVSRGGEKLVAALDGFAIDVSDLRALDAGASTGGFTDCLLRRGASEVVAVDVGYGQLDHRLRADARVRVLERTNIRDLALEAAGGEPFPVVVADLSFISLATVAPVIAGRLAAPGAHLVFLVKPQFEAGRQEASRGKGVVRDATVWRRVLGEVDSALSREGAVMMGAMVSPLLGAEGNVEFFAYLRAHAAAGATAGPGPAPSATSALLDAVVAEAVRRIER